MVLGLISDTHGLLRPEAIEALRGSDHIFHAGDVGAADVLDTLARIAPVTAVRGNVDTQLWARNLPESEIVEIGGIAVYLLHDIGRLDLKPEAAALDVVIYGHSHEPRIEKRNGVLFFNPGSAGPRRFKLPVSLGRLKIQNGTVSGELVKLPVTG